MASIARSSTTVTDAGIVGEGKRRDAARSDPEASYKSSALAERKARRAKRIGQLFQIDPAFLQRHDRAQPAFLSFRKRLCNGRRQLAAQLDRLGDREDRRMAVGFVGDAERVEAGEELVRVSGGRMGARCVARRGEASPGASPRGKSSGKSSGQSSGKSLQTPSPDVIWIGRTRV